MSANYEQRAVLFLDVLGFKQLINANREDLIEEALNITTAERGSQYSVSAFSDNMVVSTEFSRGYELYGLMQFASNLTFSLLRLGILSRGGIAVGSLRHKGSIVYGPALVEAYQIESQIAVYPRIVLARDAIAKATEAGGATDDGAELLGHLVRTDFDGMQHVHIMSHTALLPFEHFFEPGHSGTYPLDQLAAKKFESISHALDCNPASDLRSIAKHQWLQRYAAHYWTLYANG